MDLAKVDGDAVIFDPVLSAASQIHLVSIQTSRLDLRSKARCLFENVIIDFLAIVDVSMRIQGWRSK